MFEEDGRGCFMDLLFAADPSIAQKNYRELIQINSHLEPIVDGTADVAARFQSINQSSKYDSALENRNLESTIAMNGFASATIRQSEQFSENDFVEPSLAAATLRRHMFSSWCTSPATSPHSLTSAEIHATAYDSEDPSSRSARSTLNLVSPLSLDSINYSLHLNSSNVQSGEILVTGLD